MIPYVREIAFEYGRVDQVSPLIRRVIANNPGPFTYTGTGTYIVGQGEVAVIDPGPDMADHLAALLAATTGERISHILVTHHHADHSPLSRPLAARERRDRLRPRGRRPCPPKARSGSRPATTCFTPDVAVDTGAVVSGPGWTIEAIHTPGHTSNHTCYALREENALFSGDHIMGWSTTVITPPDGDMGDYHRQPRHRARARFRHPVADPRRAGHRSGPVHRRLQGAPPRPRATDPDAPGGRRRDDQGHGAGDLRRR